MIRLGLCCLFKEEPIKFRTTTAKYSGRLTTAERDKKLSELCLHNAESLLKAIRFCSSNGIGAFRVNSRILPLNTHPELGYIVKQLSAGNEIENKFRECGREASRLNIRLSFHPDQFTLLSSPDPEITRKSIMELQYQSEVAEWIGADIINIHGGGGYGDKKSALTRVGSVIDKLDSVIRKRLTLENDDRVYTPADLLPLCLRHGIPLVYDVHHHRCLPDGMSVKSVTEQALATWNREPLFHISSPKEGWGKPQPGKHHDFIDINDFPMDWRTLNITVDVEAKAKEEAVLQLQRELRAL
ncbi:MAG: UV DNA damage repair endonuclease UvsE [Kiritimatiellae bacterium]|jgi:UV DNA damage endonuclease|nr:UV DNA damage repair endonuclease UvsE [Kiritimatiellia bacterium]